MLIIIMKPITIEYKVTFQVAMTIIEQYVITTKKYKMKSIPQLFLSCFC